MRNKEKFEIWKKEYKEKNKEKTRKYNADYRKRNPNSKKINDKKYYEKNKEILIKKSKIQNSKPIRKKWKEDNKEYTSIKNKEYKEKNKEMIKKYRKEYSIKNKDKINENRRNRMKNNPMYKISTNLRNLIKNSIRRMGYTKKSRSYQILGCSFIEFKLHLESKFESWMSWDNYGKYNGELNFGWDMDHVIPISSASNEEELINLNHYSNLQPLCTFTNRNVKRDLVYNSL